MLWGEKRMFIGHFAPALLAAAVTPQRPRLGMYFIAAQLVDWVFFALLLLGAENMRVVPGITAMNPMDLYHMPYTHSLLGTAVFALGFGPGRVAWPRAWSMISSSTSFRARPTSGESVLTFSRRSRSSLTGSDRPRSSSSAIAVPRAAISSPLGVSSGATDLAGMRQRRCRSSSSSIIVCGKTSSRASVQR